jgi:5-methylcytosine-specific restriction endonuclease McrA
VVLPLPEVGVRRTALRRRTTPRRRAPGMCVWGGCHASYAPIRVTDAEVYCKSHGERTADETASRIVRERDRYCVSCGRPPSDAAHIHGRSRHQIRWLVGETTRTPGNIVALCRPCHDFYGRHPDLWRAFIDEKWPGLWRELEQVNRWGEAARIPVDVGEVIRGFRLREVA